MSLVCDLKTPQTTGRQQQECSATKSDYLRLVGYGGIVDSKYCGHNKVSIKVHGNHPLALMFKSQKRSSSSKNRDLGSLLNLLGFDCKIKCKNDLNEEEETLKNSTPTTTDDVIEKVDIVNESGESNESTVSKKYLKKHKKNLQILNFFLSLEHCRICCVTYGYYNK